MNSNNPFPAPSDNGTAPLKLPELNTKLLNDDEVAQLLRDIELCAEITEIIPKFIAQGHVPETAAITLAEARALLGARAVRGLQIRYRYQCVDWWDTLMLVRDSFRLVRIRHDFSEKAISPDAVPPPAQMPNDAESR